MSPVEFLQALTGKTVLSISDSIFHLSKRIYLCKRDFSGNRDGSRVSSTLCSNLNSSKTNLKPVPPEAETRDNRCQRMMMSVISVSDQEKKNEVRM